MITSLLASYKNGGYEVSIFSDGTKTRTHEEGCLPPVLPEQMDLKITNWCDAACVYCHENSTPRGLHADLRLTAALLETLPAGSEIAIGGGDPLSHPDFAWFVGKLADQGLIPSVTVNGRHIERHRLLIEQLMGEKKIFGLGVSYWGNLNLQPDYEHKVVHMIVGINDPSDLEDALEGTKILLLGYKEHGRGIKLYDRQSIQIRANIAKWYRYLHKLGSKFHLSFDNLAISQLNPSRLFKNQEDFHLRYMGEEGLFSMYIDAVEQTYGLSSYSEDRNGWGITSLQTMFGNVRRSQGYEVAEIS